VANVSDWDFFNRNVQSGLLEGRFMNAAFTMVAAGPPRLAAVLTPGSEVEDSDIAWPIGVIQNIGIGINANIMRLFEVGSMRSYYIRGRVVGQVTLGRIQYHGPNLLRALYAYLGNDSPNFEFDPLYTNNGAAALNTKGVAGTKQRYELPPGFENLWMDLQSDVFDQPMGLLLYLRDSNGDTVGAFYLEYCMVANYGWNTDASGTIITESTSVLYERMVPIDVQAVSLVKNSLDTENIIGASVIGSAA